jgi:hypothetical protein
MRKQQSVNPELNLGETADESLPPLTTEEVAAIEARACERRDYWSRVHAALRADAQSCARSMRTRRCLGSRVSGRISSIAPLRTTGPADR